jgi:hypothetical protein
MKTLALFLILCFGSLAFADDFKTIDGKEYKNAKVSRVEPDGIVITFSGGIVKIPFTELSPELQTKYGYDKEKAAEFAAAEAQQYQQAAAQQQQAAAEQAAREQQVARELTRKEIAKNIHTIREVKSDQLSFVDVPFMVEGEIELSSYYNYGYNDAEPTHLSFKLRSADGECKAYMERSKAAALRKSLVDSGGPLKGLFSVVLLKSRYKEGSGDLFSSCWITWERNNEAGTSQPR